METNDKGSDLDVFEGLSKKGGLGSPSDATSTAPPPPPTRPSDGAQRALLSITSPGVLPVPPPPASTPSVAGVSRPPPPPPGRGSLPPMPAAPPEPAGSKAGTDVDWDDEDEATQIFDKADDMPPRLNAAPLPAAGAPPPSMSMKSTLLGLTPPPGASSPASGRFSPAPPPPGGGLGRNSSIPSQAGPGALPPPAFGTLPPPSPTLTGLGGSRSIPPPPPGALPMTGPAMMGAAGATMPPTRMGMASDRPPPRGVSPSSQATALLHPQQSWVGRWGFMTLAAVLVLGVVWFLVPHTGHIVINVTDPRGSGVGRVDIFVDGRKQCDTAPCIVEQASGSHEVKVLADGYDVPASQGINVEARKDSMATFVLGSAPKGTGVKVGGTQPGVKLYVDDKEIGPLPQDYRDITPGDHVVKIVGSERYQPLERRVTVERDRVEDLGSVTLRVLKGKVTVSLGTPGARVFLVSGADRRELPMLPISVDIDTNKAWSLQAMRLGFAEYNQPISFDDGQAEKSYVVTLEPKGQPGMLSGWTAPPPAQAPQAFQAVGAAQPVQRQAPPPQMASVPPQPPAPANGAGAGGEGFLNINSIPPSTCYLDGKQLGPTPKVRVSVTPGTHQVKFVNAEQNLTKTISIVVGGGETKLAVAKLSN
jgi:hypothetical protein